MGHKFYNLQCVNGCKLDVSVLPLQVCSTKLAGILSEIGFVLNPSFFKRWCAISAIFSNVASKSSTCACVEYLFIRSNRFIVFKPLFHSGVPQVFVRFFN